MGTRTENELLQTAHLKSGYAPWICWGWTLLVHVAVQGLILIRGKSLMLDISPFPNTASRLFGTFELRVRKQRLTSLQVNPWPCFSFYLCQLGISTSIFCEQWMQSSAQVHATSNHFPSYLNEPRSLPVLLHLPSTTTSIVSTTSTSAASFNHLHSSQ